METPFPNYCEPWCFVLQTLMDLCTQLVLHLLPNVHTDQTTPHQDICSNRPHRHTAWGQCGLKTIQTDTLVMAARQWCDSRLSVARSCWNDIRSSANTAVVVVATASVSASVAVAVEPRCQSSVRVSSSQSLTNSCTACDAVHTTSNHHQTQACLLLSNLFIPNPPYLSPLLISYRASRVLGSSLTSNLLEFLAPISFSALAQLSVTSLENMGR